MLTSDTLKKLLAYDPDTGAFAWLVSPRSGVRLVGSEAGRINQQGYVQIQIFSKRHQAHRLAWLYVHGSWPTNDIDHINCIKNDNRISNLREATASENNFNRGPQRSNISGFKGVCRHRQTNSWQAQIGHHGENHYLGLFDTPELAHAAYCEAARRLHGGFANTGLGKRT